MQPGDADRQIPIVHPSGLVSVPDIVRPDPNEINLSSSALGSRQWLLSGVSVVPNTTFYYARVHQTEPCRLRFWESSAPTYRPETSGLQQGVYPDLTYFFLVSGLSIFMISSTNTPVAFVITFVLNVYFAMNEIGSLNPVQLSFRVLKQFIHLHIIQAYSSVFDELFLASEMARRASSNCPSVYYPTSKFRDFLSPEFRLPPFFSLMAAEREIPIYRPTDRIMKVRLYRMAVPPAVIPYNKAHVLNQMRGVLPHSSSFCKAPTTICISPCCRYRTPMYQFSATAWCSFRKITLFEQDNTISPLMRHQQLPLTR